MGRHDNNPSPAVIAQGVADQLGRHREWSALGERSIPLQSAYCGAKHATNGFISLLRCELLHEGSGGRVTVVQMPAVNTPQFSWVRSTDLPARGRGARDRAGS